MKGRVVKGVKFQNLRDAGDPVELSFHYQDQGADELVLLDVTATRQERIAMLETIERVRQKLSIPLTVGGGIGSIEDAGRLLKRWRGQSQHQLGGCSKSRPD